MELFKYDNVKPVTLEELSKKEYSGSGDIMYEPTIIGGTLRGASYQSNVNGARLEIFPSYNPTIGLQILNSDNENVFKAEIDGVNSGDITIGDYANNKGLLWDDSLGIFNVKGKITATSITTNQQEITVETTESIQDAITELGASGGTIRLKAGTYTLTDDLVIPSDVVIQGQGMGVTVLYFATANKSVKAEGSDSYSTGTVSISNGGQVVTGAGTSWLTNVTTNHKIRLDNYWYDIYAVGADDSITLTTKYVGEDLSGVAYDSAIMVENFKINDLAVVYSGGNGIYINYAYYFFLDNVASTNNVGDGLSINNSTSFSLRYVNCFDNGSDGMYFNQVDHAEGNVLWCLRNTAKGVNASGIYDSNIVSILSRNNTAGVYISGIEDSVINASDVSNNTGIGLEILSSASLNLIAVETQDNGSDGIKLTSNCDSSTITGCTTNNNTGYGINIANANCDTNIINSCILRGNTAGEFNDSGTGTITGTNDGIPYTGSTVTVPGGGTGLTSLTAYSLMCGGTTATGNMQQVASVGTSGQVLTSNGAAALPTFQTLTGPQYAVASATSQYTSAAEVYNGIGNTYVSKSFTSLISGSIRITYEYKQDTDTTGTNLMELTKQGTAGGNTILQVITDANKSTSYRETTVDVNVNAGDYLTLRYKNDNRASYIKSLVVSFTPTSIGTTYII